MSYVDNTTNKFYGVNKYDVKNYTDLWGCMLALVDTFCVFVFYYLPHITRLQLQKDAQIVRKNGKDT